MRRSFASSASGRYGTGNPLCGDKGRGPGRAEGMSGLLNDNSAMHPTQTIPPVLWPRALTTVEINGIATPFNRALDSLQRFCRPLLLHRENSAFDLAYSGSSFLFRHRARNFLICCKHQLGRDNIRFSPHSICLIVNDNERWKALTPDSSTIVKVDSYCDRTAEDILLIEYQPERGGHALTMYFVSLNLDTIQNLASVTRDQIVLIFAIGYPTRFSDYDVNFDRTESPVSVDIVSRWAKLYLQVRERSDWDLA
jgi:hypothetical protein